MVQGQIRHNLRQIRFEKTKF